MNAHVVTMASNQMRAYLEGRPDIQEAMDVETEDLGEVFMELQTTFRRRPRVGDCFEIPGLDEKEIRCVKKAREFDRSRCLFVGIEPIDCDEIGGMGDMVDHLIANGWTIFDPDLIEWPDWAQR